MTRIVLIRHGQALAYTEQIVAGHLCKGLSDHGLGTKSPDGIRYRE